MRLEKRAKSIKKNLTNFLARRRRIIENKGAKITHNSLNNVDTYAQNDSETLEQRTTQVIPGKSTCREVTPNAETFSHVIQIKMGDKPTAEMESSIQIYRNAFSMVKDELEDDVPQTILELVGDACG